MKVFGNTGGVGAGKSEVLTYLGQNYDATVIQADEAGYLVMLPGGECYGEIVKLFGRQITTETGELDRKRIAEIVFQDEEKLKALNAIVHPAVKRYIKKAMAAAEKAGTEYVFVEAALLIKEKYDEKELGKFTSEGKDKLWLQKSHYYDASLRSVFYCGYRYAICQYDALCTKCYCCRPGGENLQDKC